MYSRELNDRICNHCTEIRFGQIKKGKISQNSNEFNEGESPLHKFNIEFTISKLFNFGCF